MNVDVNAFVNKIIGDAEAKVRTDLVHISSLIKKDFVQQANDAVLLYYSNYMPKEYNRTFNLQNNVVDEDVSFSVLNGSGYGAWVQFNSNGMFEYDMGSKDVVVSNFMYGIHGRKSVFVESNPAVNLMGAFQENYKIILDGYFAGLGYTVK